MKRFNKNLLGILSCLMFLATLPVFAQTSLNRKPLKDFAANLTSKVDKSEVDLTKPFSITLEAYLTTEGKFDREKSKFTKSEGDEDIVEAAKSAIEAVGDSGIFAYLQQLGVEKAIINFSQNEKEVLSIINSEAPTAEKAKTFASGFNGLLMLAKMNTKEDIDVQTLLNATKISVEGKNFILNLTLPKEEAHKLLNQKLQKEKEKSYSN